MKDKVRALCIERHHTRRELMAATGLSEQRLETILNELQVSGEIIQRRNPIGAALFGLPPDGHRALEMAPNKIARRRAA